MRQIARDVAKPLDFGCRSTDPAPVDCSCNIKDVGLNGFAVAGCGTVAGWIDRGYYFEGRELVSASGLEEKEHLDDTVAHEDDRRHASRRVGGLHPGRLSPGGSRARRALSALARPVMRGGGAQLSPAFA